MKAKRIHSTFKGLAVGTASCMVLVVAGEAGAQSGAQGVILYDELTISELGGNGGGND